MMLDVNLLSQMGLLVVGGPLLIFGLVSFVLSGVAYGVRTMRRLPAWEGMTRPLIFLGVLMVIFGAAVVMPALPMLLRIMA
ncbi:hypothetical protein [Bifidobacterium vespertilionis]|uniref:Uncharacterized protein n=1 Tax=Bifidobacterium vespertilionis TaxID=2562524 RepID=A0A5J5E2Z9_9BIFI|nr:hypothetical protein [Bifidobacterium vespertilionis]KAA8822010.1 hypothetical protein EMO90_02060 [Bifidobacterium vespertilionis]KAA8823549.1 hypothetical protein EM848_05225 [Bifidobacterium vespertilionis]MBT1179538.1 hypothetical protein [Bifidobacterium vespertilionis]